MVLKALVYLFAFLFIAVVTVFGIIVIGLMAAFLISIIIGALSAL